jgi:hypothetical protein
MMKNIIIKIGCVLLMILKGIVWSALTVLKLALEFLKVTLLLFGLIMRVFLAFVRVGTA